MRTLLIIVTAIIDPFHSVAQEKEPIFIDTIQNLLGRGVFLENKNVTIPWHTDFIEISKYGDPTIVKESNRSRTVRWDSAVILSGIKVSLGYSTYKVFLGGGKFAPLTTLYGNVDSINFQKAKSFIERYTGTQGKLLDSKKRTAYQWIVNGCGLRVGYLKANKKYPIKYFLDFQRI